MPKILIIDDDRDLLKVAKILLSRRGFDVHCWSYGSNIYETIRTYKPNLVLLDMLLGGYSGLDICKEIKKISADLPVIIFSADPRKSSAHLECGAHDFIAKPFEVNDLISKVNMHLKHSAEI